MTFERGFGIDDRGRLPTDVVYANDFRYFIVCIIMTGADALVFLRKDCDASAVAQGNSVRASYACDKPKFGPSQKPIFVIYNYLGFIPYLDECANFHRNR
jgi:hypothetical protein